MCSCKTESVDEIVRKAVKKFFLKAIETKFNKSEVGVKILIASIILSALIMLIVGIVTTSSWTTTEKELKIDFSIKSLRELNDVSKGFIHAKLTVVTNLALRNQGGYLRQSEP